MSSVSLVSETVSAETLSVVADAASVFGEAEAMLWEQKKELSPTEV